MAALTNRLTLNYRDVAGKVTKVIVLVAAAVIDPTGTAVAAIRGAIQAVSRCMGNRAAISIPAADTDSTTAGDYPNIEDKVSFTFIDSNGKRHNYKVPSPRPTIFQADKQTVDLTNALVTAFRDAMLAVAKSEDGATLVSLVSGRRFRTKQQVR